MDYRASIDFDSHIPFYLQLVNILREQINQKVWQPGQLITREQDLCERYGISRTVVRQALRELELEGLITRRKGKGTFVAEPKISEGLVQKLTGFYQDMVERGLKPITRVLRQEVTAAEEKIAKYLAIEPGAPVVVIKRLRFINDQPIQIVTTYLPLQVCPELPSVNLTQQSLYEYLEKECHIILDRGHRFVEAVAASEEEARLLDIERGFPVLMLDSISYLADGTPIEYYHAVHRGDRSRFEVDLFRVRDPHGSAANTGVTLAPLFQ